MGKRPHSIAHEPSLQYKPTFLAQRAQHVARPAFKQGKIREERAQHRRCQHKTVQDDLGQDGAGRSCVMRLNEPTQMCVKYGIRNTKKARTGRAGAHLSRSE